ncbi:MAG: efflux RND transporter periplasmic adaptor subunit, partial [Cyclobacteriaceae bacterium]|nr:efflux RND transporter periplasmic adaptor subunit [Cyclobacteriaceae bacterium]
MKTIISISIAIVLSVWMTSCQEKPSEVMEAQMERDTEAGTVIELTKAQIAAADIALGKMEKKTLSQQVQVNGYFDVPPQNKAQVSAYKAGYVKKTTLLVGDKVKKRQVLVVLENPEFVKAQQNFMEVKGQLDYLKAEYERKKI